MLKSAWLEFGKGVQCPHCKATGQWTYSMAPPTSPHGEKVSCAACGVFLRWLSKDKHVVKRERLPNGTAEQVWEDFHGYCACCGIHRDELAALGIGCTIQHAPPYDLMGNDSHLLPFCTWCQARASAEMIRMRTALRKMRHAD